MKEYIFPSLIIGVIGAIWWHFCLNENVHVLLYFIPGVIGAVYHCIFGEEGEKNPFLGFFGGQIIIPMIGILFYYFPILVLPWIIVAAVTCLFPNRKNS
jgi:hypothetical protein